MRFLMLCSFRQFFAAVLHVPPCPRPCIASGRQRAAHRAWFDGENAFVAFKTRFHWFGVILSGFSGHLAEQYSH
jgi:hypothetical protein